MARSQYFAIYQYTKFKSSFKELLENVHPLTITPVVSFDANVALTQAPMLNCLPDGRLSASMSIGLLVQATIAVAKVGTLTESHT